MLSRIALEQELEDTAPVFCCTLRFHIHNHAVCCGSSAGRDQLVLTLDRHETDAAIADDRKLWIPAEGRYIDAGATRGLENRSTGLKGNGRAVDSQRRHWQP